MRHNKSQFMVDLKSGEFNVHKKSGYLKKPGF